MDILRRVQKFYKLEPIESLKQGSLSSEKVEGLIDVLSDTMFNYGIDLTAKLHGKNSIGPTFFRYITYPAKHTLANLGTTGIRTPPIENLK